MTARYQTAKLAADCWREEVEELAQRVKEDE